jgi:hypothetical protein
MRLFARLAPLASLVLGCAAPPAAPDDGPARPDEAAIAAEASMHVDAPPPDTSPPRDASAPLDAPDMIDAGARPDDAGMPDAPDARLPRDAGSDVRPDPPPPRRYWWDNERIDPDLVPDPIWGDGHVHSDFSGDGHHPALAMMNRAKELGADFVWITDHTQTPSNPGGVSAAEFGACSARGRDATDGDRFAGCGVEYRLGYVRANGSRVFEAWHQIVHDIAPGEFGEVLNVQGYTSWPAYQRDLARTQAYAVITHPSGPTPWFDDDDAAFRDTDPSNHPNTELIELNGGDDDARNGNNQVDGINAYLRFLGERWQVSPVWDSDMHHFYPGPERAKGYGTWVDRRQWRPDSFRAVLRAAARRHVSFANHPGDERNWIRMVSLAPSGGAPEAMMGSTLPPRPTLRLRVRANIDRGRERWTFRLYTNRDARFDSPARAAGAAATEAVDDGRAQQWEPTLDTTGLHWVVAYASADDGPPGPATQYLVSAPIWLNNR